MSTTKLFLIFNTIFLSLFFSVYSNAVPLIFDDYDACMVSKDSNNSYVPTSKVGKAFKTEYVNTPDIDEASRLIIKRFAGLIRKKEAINEVLQDIQLNNRQLYGNDAEALLYFLSPSQYSKPTNGGANIDAYGH